MRSSNIRFILVGTNISFSWAFTYDIFCTSGYEKSADNFFISSFDGINFLVTCFNSIAGCWIEMGSLILTSLFCYINFLAISYSFLFYAFKYSLTNLIYYNTYCSIGVWYYPLYLFNFWSSLCSDEATSITLGFFFC